MPWDAKQFAGKHNKKLKGAAASKAASQASAMVKAAVPEGEAIATANKTGDRMQSKHSGSSPKSPAEQMAKRRGQGLTYRQVASEHGVSASTAHRKVRDADDMMRQGYQRVGSAD
jgi:hypothetical protein